MGKAAVVGLDIGTTSIKAIEVSRNRGVSTITGFASVPLPVGALQDGEVVEPNTVAASIKLAWSEGKFSTKDAIIGVGNQRIIVREADLPYQPLPGLKKSLPFQAQQMLPTAASDALLDYVPAAEYEGPDGRFVQGLFVAAIRETVTANVLASESGGVRPLVVDLNAFAIQRALTQGDLRNYTVAFVDVGAQITNVVIAERGTSRFVRILPHGGQNTTDAVAHSAGTSLVEAERLKRDIGVGYQVPVEYAHVADSVLHSVTTLVESIRSTFVYYQSKNLGSPIDAIVLSGGGSLLKGFGQYLSSATRLPIQVGNPLEKVKVAKSVNLGAFQGSETSLTVALGLALGELE